MAGERIHRITFSESLARYLAGLTGLAVRKVRLRVGLALQPNQPSQSGLYALLAKQSGKLLRVSLNREIAALHCDDQWRYLAECWVVP